MKKLEFTLVQAKTDNADDFSCNGLSGSEVEEIKAGFQLFEIDQGIPRGRKI
jgi:hypothetical protein